MLQVIVLDKKLPSPGSDLCSPKPEWFSPRGGTGFDIGPECRAGPIYEYRVKFNARNHFLIIKLKYTNSGPNGFDI